MHHADEILRWRTGASATLLAVTLLALGCSSTTVQNWKPQRLSSAASPKTGKASLSASKVITPQDILDDAHEASRTIWCSIPGPGGKMIWVQVK